MPSRRLESHFPYLAGYLGRFQAPTPVEKSHYAWGLGCLATAVAVPSLVAITFFVGMLSNWQMWTLPAMIVSFLVSLFGGLWLTSRVAAKQNKPLPAEDQKRIEVGQVVERFKNLDTDLRLTASLDPTAMEFLEAGAFHWTRVSQALEGPYFSSARLAGHWKTIGQEAKSAADSAMADLMLLAFQCMGEPPRTKQDDLREMMSDLKQGDVMEALTGLRGVVERDWREYSYRSPQMGSLFEPARELCESLKNLADQLEPMAMQQVTEEVMGGKVETYRVASASSIELLINEMKAVRQAEDELSNEQRS